MEKPKNPINETIEINIIKKMAAAITDIIKKYIKKYIKKAPYTWEFKTKVLDYEDDEIYRIKYLDVEYKAVSAYQFDVGYGKSNYTE